MGKNRIQEKIPHRTRHTTRTQTAYADALPPPPTEINAKMSIHWLSISNVFAKCLQDNIVTIYNTYSNKNNNQFIVGTWKWLMLCIDHYACLYISCALCITLWVCVCCTAHSVYRFCSLFVFYWARRCLYVEGYSFQTLCKLEKLL